MGNDNQQAPRYRENPLAPRSEDVTREMVYEYKMDT